MELIELLKKPLLFSGLNDADLAELATITVRRAFRKGETLFCEGDEATGFYLLVSGQHQAVPHVSRRSGKGAAFCTAP